MKKVILSLCGLASLYVCSAQISLGVNTNYTMYKGDFGKSTAGLGIRGSYQSDRNAGTLSFTNGFPITQNSTTYVSNSSGSQKEVATQDKLTFRTIGLSATRSLIGSEESAGKFYAGANIGFVLVSYSSTITGSYDKNVYTAPDMEGGNESGFTIGALAGGEYKIGRPVIFAEAGIALPANQVNDQYVTNYIPAHFMFNLGVKFRLGGE